MTISRRRLFGYSTGIAAAATLAACGSNQGGLGASSNPATSATGGTGAKPALAQWYHEYGEAGVQEAVKRYASEYKDADVAVKWNPGDYDKLVPAALLTDSFPDVFEFANGPTLDMIKAGQVADLTDLLGDAKGDFNPNVMKRLTFKDKVWAIPQTVDMQLLYYRPSLLKKAGLQPPKTFAELADAAKALKTNDMGGFFAGNDGGVGVLGTMFIWASGHEQLNEARSEAAFLTPEFYNALVAYRDLVKSGAVLEAASNDWFAPNAIAQGEAAMQWGGLWSMPEIKQALGDDFGVLPFPAIGSSGRQAVPFGAFSACVAAKGKNVDAAKNFVKWLWIDNEDAQVDFSNSYGTHIPAKPKLVSKADKLASGPGADAAKYVEESGFTNDIMWTGPLGDAFSAAVTNVIKKNADPATEFKAVGERAAAELKRVG